MTRIFRVLRSAWQKTILCPRRVGSSENRRTWLKDVSSGKKGAGGVAAEDADVSECLAEGVADGHGGVYGVGNISYLC